MSKTWLEREKTEFDVLPLILQADGKDPELFELPEDLVLQVELTHPKYKSEKIKNKIKSI